MVRKAIFYGRGVGGVKKHELAISNAELIKTVAEFNPDRLNLILSKLNLTNSEALLEFSQEELLDKLLGIDDLVSFEDNIFGIDITTGKNTVILNKVKKHQNLEPLLQHLGISKTIVLCPRSANIEEDDIVDFITDLERIADSDLFATRLKVPNQNINHQSFREAMNNIFANTASA